MATMRALLSLCALTYVAVAAAKEDDWQPIVPEPSLSYTSYANSSKRSLKSSQHIKTFNWRPEHLPYGTNKVSSLNHSLPASMSESCSVYKVSMNQELFYQYLEYETQLPDLKEFTLCMWTKFHNHSEDHPLFSYSVVESPKEISSWISNTNEASYFSMSVHGQTFFRLNYPLRINTWYHSCQSWNGKTGEWQIWVNAERVGRGFHNRLVGHVIKGGGIAVSGQDQSSLYSKEGTQPVLKQAGLIGEITMLQLYRVALTAGKAHKDHKHHHAHHFKHDGTPVEGVTEAATESSPPLATPLGNGNFLIGGQLQRSPNLNLAMLPQPLMSQMVQIPFPDGVQLQQEYVQGQLGNKIISERFLNNVKNNERLYQFPVYGQSVTTFHESSRSQGSRQPLAPLKGTSVVRSSTLINPDNLQYTDDTISHNLFKRDSQKRDKRDNPENEIKEEESTGNKNKRDLVQLSDGSVVDQALLSSALSDDLNDYALFEQSLMNGLAGVVGNILVQNVQKKTVDEREPAEAEVKAVMQVCSGCTDEPFKKALVLSWRSSPKKLHSGAHYYKGLPICKAF